MHGPMNVKFKVPRSEISGGCSKQLGLGSENVLCHENVRLRSLTMLVLGHGQLQKLRYITYKTVYIRSSKFVIFIALTRVNGDQMCGLETFSL